MPFIKFDFFDVMHTFRRYMSVNGLNLISPSGNLLFNNILLLMKFFDDNRFVEEHPIRYTYPTFDFVDVKVDKTTSTKYEGDTSALIETEDIYHIIHRMIKSTIKYKKYIKDSCNDYMLLVDWMFN